MKNSESWELYGNRFSGTEMNGHYVDIILIFEHARRAITQEFVICLFKGQVCCLPRMMMISPSDEKIR